MEDLIISVLMGEASAGEVRALDRWRNESRENERVYQEYAHVWHILPLHPSQEPVNAPPPVEQIVAAGDRRRRRAIPLSARQVPRRGAWQWIFAAAAAAAATVVFCLSGLFSRSPQLTISTGPNEIKTVALEDGSFVRLGPSSTLAFHIGKTRRARLFGDGFFAVASDSASPFIVATNLGTAEVFGTRFELRAGSDSLRLVVVEGSVGLSGSGRRVRVGPGEMSRIADNVPPTVPRQVNVGELLQWRDGLLIFQDTPLRDVVAEVGAHFGVRFHFKDPDLGRHRVTTWFEDEPFEEVVATICHVVGVRCTLGDDVEIAR